MCSHQLTSHSPRPSGASFPSVVRPPRKGTRVRLAVLAAAICLVTMRASAVTVLWGPNNPAARSSTGGMVLAFKNLAAGRYNFHVVIYDAVGNIVFDRWARDYYVHSEHAGKLHGVVDWDLRNRAGRLVGSGEYASRTRIYDAATGQQVHVDATPARVGGTKVLTSTVKHTISGPPALTIYGYHQPGYSGRAIVCVEGFDPGGRNNLSNLMSRWFPLYCHDDWGSHGDVYYINFHDGAADIPSNATSLEAALAVVDESPRNYSEIVVMGYSMGGLIARYALLLNEQHRKIPVKKFISLDSPQQGAVINLSVQGAMLHLSQQSTVDLVAEWGIVPDAMALQEAIGYLQFPAPQQMLYNHVNWVQAYMHADYAFSREQMDQLRAVSSTSHDYFYAELHDLGDYPQATKNYAIAKSEAVPLHPSWAVNQTIGTFYDGDYTLYADPQDLNPGSYVDDFATGDFAWKSGFGKYPTFIPLESALDLRSLPGKDAAGRITRSYSREELWLYSAFDEVYVRPRYNHVDVCDDLLMSYIFEILADESPKRPASRALPPLAAKIGY